MLTSEAKCDLCQAWVRVYRKAYRAESDYQARLAIEGRWNRIQLAIWSGFDVDRPVTR